MMEHNLLWLHESIDISAYADQQITLRFYFRTDGSQTFDGWYVDNVKVSVYSGIIPVELVSFTSSIINNSVNLNWITATELNNSGFDIEKSIDNSTWNKIDLLTEMELQQKYIIIHLQIKLLLLEHLITD